MSVTCKLLSTFDHLDIEQAAEAAGGGGREVDPGGGGDGGEGSTFGQVDIGQAAGSG